MLALSVAVVIKKPGLPTSGARFAPCIPVSTSVFEFFVYHSLPWFILPLSTSLHQLARGLPLARVYPWLPQDPFHSGRYSGRFSAQNRSAIGSSALTRVFFYNLHTNSTFSSHSRPLAFSSVFSVEPLLKLFIFVHMVLYSIAASLGQAPARVEIRPPCQDEVRK